jgi:hypothetical protein
VKLSRWQVPFEQSGDNLPVWPTVFQKAEQALIKLNLFYLKTCFMEKLSASITKSIILN